MPSSLGADGRVQASTVRIISEKLLEAEQEAAAIRAAAAEEAARVRQGSTEAMTRRIAQAEAGAVAVEEDARRRAEAVRAEARAVLDEVRREGELFRALLAQLFDRSDGLMMAVEGMFGRLDALQGELAPPPAGDRPPAPPAPPPAPPAPPAPAGA